MGLADREAIEPALSHASGLEIGDADSFANEIVKRNGERLIAKRPAQRVAPRTHERPGAGACRARL